MNWLNAAAFTLFGTPTSWAELLGFATGLVNVWLVVRQKIANWPVGIANVILLSVAFLAAGLYADASLQIVYVILGFYGWWQWVYGGTDRTHRTVRRTSSREWPALLVAGVVLTAVMWYVLDRYTNSTVPLADATTTALSLVATYGQSMKLLESWWFWIAADLIYIPLYGVKELWLTAVLYTVFLALCVIGLRTWRAALAGAAAPEGATALA